MEILVGDVTEGDVTKWFEKDARWCFEGLQNFDKASEEISGSGRTIML